MGHAGFALDGVRSQQEDLRDDRGLEDRPIEGEPPYVYLDDPDDAELHIGEVVVGISEERGIAQCAGPLCRRIGGRDELRLDVSRSTPGRIVEIGEIVLHRTLRCRWIDVAVPFIHNGNPTGIFCSRPTSVAYARWLLNAADQDVVGDVRDRQVADRHGVCGIAVDVDHHMVADLPDGEIVQAADDGREVELINIAFEVVDRIAAPAGGESSLHV